MLLYVPALPICSSHLQRPPPPPLPPPLGRRLQPLLPALCSQPFHFMSACTLQGAPLHSKSRSDHAYYVRGPLSHPTAVNALSTHGVAMLHLVAGLGYDWACVSLIRRGADSNLPVRHCAWHVLPCCAELLFLAIQTVKCSMLTFTC